MTPRRSAPLDSASLYFRAFYGVPERTAADGTPNNALRGFADMIATLLTTYEPTDIVACWDTTRPRSASRRSRATRRTARFDVAMRRALNSPQVPPDPRTVELAGITRLGVDGYEVDDVIGTDAPIPRRRPRRRRHR